MRNEIETSVLIVGAGPTGLALALDLGWRGLDCVVIDEQDGEISLPRAATTTARTMEFCRRWGIADDVAQAGFPQDYQLDIVYCTSLSGHLLEREVIPALAHRRPPPFSPVERSRCPQKFFNPVLARAAARYPGVELRYFSKLERFEQIGDYVIADVRALPARAAYSFTGEDLGQKVQLGVHHTPPSLQDRDIVRVKARYLVACDGVDSGIRTALDIPFEGEPKLNYTLSLLFRCPWLQKYHDKGEAERYMLIGPEGVWGNLTVVDGREEWRLSLTGFNEKINLDALDKEALVRRALGSDDIPFDIMGFSTWRRREVVARDMRQGRVFLAGDSAHSMSPTGGFGMNTCLQDVVDLGWKLEGVLRGWAPESLLDTYQVERKPVAYRIAKAATALFKPWLLELDYSQVLDDSDEGEENRRRIGATLKREMYAEWATWGTAFGYRYDESPICVPDGTPAPPDDPVYYLQCARPGSRAPHAWLSDGRSTLDLFGRGFVLLRFNSDNSGAESIQEAAASKGVPLKIVDITEPEVAAWYEKQLVLVRPDGHVAWRADHAPESALDLIDTVRGAARNSP